MRHVALAAILVASLAAGDAAAQTGRISSAYVGCLTKEALSEFITAATRSDTRHMQSMLGSICFPIEGLEYSVVDRGMMQSQLRVYIGNDSALLWTVSEAIRR